MGACGGVSRARIRGKKHRAVRGLLRPLLTLVLLASLSGCTGDPQRAVLWEGFGYSWDLLSHRIAFLRAGVAPQGPEAVEAQLGIIGGPWSTGGMLTDQPSYLLRWREVESRYFRTAARDWAMTIPAGGLQMETVRLEFNELGFLGSGSYAVALQGVEWDTDIPQTEDFPGDYNPADGWTPQGFGAGVEFLSSDEEGVELSLWSHFKAGPLDREDMNEAVPFAQVGATLRFLLFEMLPQAEPVFTPGVLEASAYYPIDPPNTPHPNIPEEERRMMIQGQPGRSFGIPLLQSWDFVLNRSLNEEGRYLREFRAGVESFQYEAEAAQAEIVVDGFASLSSLIEEGDLEVEFRAEVGLLQWEDEDAVHVPAVLEGASDTLGQFDQVVSSP